METQTIITVLLALVACYRLVKLLVYIITGFVVIIALFVIGWGVYRKVGRKKNDRIRFKDSRIEECLQ